MEVDGEIELCGGYWYHIFVQSRGLEEVIRDDDNVEVKYGRHRLACTLVP